MKFLAYLALIAVASVVGWLIRAYINKRDIASLPEPMERVRLIKELRKRRQQGENYDQCYQYLRSQGLRKGVAEGMLIDVESEQPPDLENTNTLIWNDWTCEYPGNWKEKPDEDLADHLAVNLEGIGGSAIMFYRHPDIKGNELTDVQAALYDKPQVKEFNSWGPLEGKGSCIQGIQKTYKLAMETMVFEAAPPIHLVILQITIIEEEPGASQAFDLIESSFKTVKSHQTHEK